MSNHLIEARIARAACLAGMPPIKSHSLSGVARRSARDLGNPENWDDVCDDSIVQVLRNILADTPSEFGPAPETRPTLKGGRDAAVDRLEAANKQAENLRKQNTPASGKAELTDAERSMFEKGGWSSWQIVQYLDKKKQGKL
jgi:hypothetical protein